MTAAQDSWLAPLREAYLAPWSTAESWRADDGRVCGILGRSVPRELVLAAGMLPVRLSPLRLGPPGPRSAALPPGLERELAPGPARVLAALLDGRLDWLDGLVIGRDSEHWIKLFHVVRELAAVEPELALPPVAFFDLLRLPSRTSARYNRLRARELLRTLAIWAGPPAGPEELHRAAREEAATRAALRRVAQLPVRGSELLIATGAVQVLPGPEARAALEAASPHEAEGAPRVFMTGSGQDDPWTYEALEELGLVVAGDDHEWGEDVAELADTPDPLDGIVDRVHLSQRGAARGGLADRVGATVARLRELRADAVLQIAFEHDEAPGWELPLLRATVGEAVPVEPVRLAYGRHDEEPLRRAAQRLSQCVRHRQAHALRDSARA